MPRVPRMLFPSDRDQVPAKPKLPAVLQLSAQRTDRAAMLTTRFADLIGKARRGKLSDHDIKKPKQATDMIDQKARLQREKDLRRRREESRRKLERMKPTALFDDNASILKEFSALCGCPTIPYRFEGSSSLENFGLRLKRYTYDDIEEALRLDDAERKRHIEEGEIV
ncbi:transcription factor GTE8-like protein [Corchorus olitorius]|uniref:Transcription factor GTE8-like protein n=1 Tax=Corchorus olitorius TaxID=93759 RepID=A0A1R3GW80_9ROSI|nr:transcription factor GTE8-like protein [Corchorus olitorius]